MFDKCHNLVPVMSIEGGKEETDTIRGENVYDKFANISSFHEKGLLFGVFVTVTTQNLEEVISSSGRDRRMNPTKTIYKVYYRATDGSGYQWSEQAITRELGQEIVDAGDAVERRVLVIPTDRSYITVEPDQTAESYTAGLRQRYITTLVLAGAYVLLYVAVWCILIFIKKQREVL